MVAVSRFISRPSTSTRPYSIHEPVTMSTAKHASILSKRADDVLNDLGDVDGVGLFAG